MANWRSNRPRTTLSPKPTIVISLFIAVNLLFLLLHTSPHPPTSLPTTTPSLQNSTTHLPKDSIFPTLKPWPELPSFSPWIPSSGPVKGSCEGYFGNGFTKKIEFLGKKKEKEGGWFECLFSETLRSSVCHGGMIKMDPLRIQMSRGGENLEEVMRREEEEELPRFEYGSFEIEGSDGERLASERLLDEFVPRGAVRFHTMRELIGSIRVVGKGKLQCSQWIEEPVLLVTRFEYANLFHTVTDWYSAYASSRISDLPRRPHLIFVDGHCKAEQLESTWQALFSSVRYAKSLTGPVCFRHVILSPLGYETALFKGLSESVSCRAATAKDLKANPDDRKTARLAEFGEMIRAAFGLPIVDPPVDRSDHRRSILFVRREDYVAHPRHNGRVESRLSNEAEVFDSVKRWAADRSTRCNISVVNGLFGHMDMRDQLKAVLEASVVVGAHGAGLTHLVVASPKTVVLEILSSLYRRPHFQLISQWKGLDYNPIHLSGSHADPQEVIRKLTDIVKRLGC